MKAFIFCRGGSKGIPKKNIKEFCGVPLLERTIRNLQNASAIDEVYLSTDCPEIRSIGMEAGAMAPILRPAELAEDNADQFDAHQHIFAFLGIPPSESVLIVNNNPFIFSDLIDEVVSEHLRNTDRIVLDGIKVSSDYLYFRQVSMKFFLVFFYYLHKELQHLLDDFFYIQF